MENPIVIYEDNHIIVALKPQNMPSCDDESKDLSLLSALKDMIKERDNKPGNVYLGVVHRLDRPVSGVVLFAKTSKALPRLNKMFAEHNKVNKTYWAIVQNRPQEPQGTLTHWLTRQEKNNTARAYDREVPGSKKAVLDYELIASGDRYHLLEIHLHTGRHHQIRCQLAKIGCPIKGDLKYGAPRSNPDGSISLHARTLTLEHPVNHESISVTAPVPDDKLWLALSHEAIR